MDSPDVQTAFAVLDASGALASAGVELVWHRKEGVHLVVLFDRVKSVLPPDRLHGVLGYVLVHEITHVLQGRNHHAEKGIMKAHTYRRRLATAKKRARWKKSHRATREEQTG